jgi:hypothetical protein
MTKEERRFATELAQIKLLIARKSAEVRQVFGAGSKGVLITFSLEEACGSLQLAIEETQAHKAA